MADAVARRWASDLKEWYLRNPETGKRVVGQWPNGRITIVGLLGGAWLVLRARGMRRGSPAEEAIRTTAAVYYAWWAVDEVLRGGSPYRRTVGLLGLSALGAAVWLEAERRSGSFSR